MGAFNVVFYLAFLTYSFRILSPRHAVLMSLGVLCIWTTQSLIHQGLVENLASLSLERWHGELVMRLAMSSRTPPANNDEWRELSRLAVEDIRSNFENEKWEEEVAGGAFVPVAIQVLVAIPAFGGLIVLAYFLSKVL